MLVKSINATTFRNYRLNVSKNDTTNFDLNKNSNPKTFTSPVFLGISQVYSDQIQELKAGIKLHPKDIEYRKQLMTNAGKNPDEYYKLRSIIGLNEIKSILADFHSNEEAYSVGINDKNITNKTFRANLHIHTVASDGHLTTQELLDQATVYANEVAQNPAFKQEPFIIAITDHDTTDSAKEAIEIIAKDPLKYKNLRVILGLEATTYNDIAVDITKQPTAVHTLIYGIDPNEKTFNDFIESTKQKKAQIISKMINQSNEIYKKMLNKKEDLFLTEQAQDFFNPLKKNILGIYNYVSRYVETKVILNEIVLKNPILAEAITQNNLALSADELMTDMQKFYFLVDRTNNASREPEMTSKYLSSKTNIPADEIKEIIKKGLNSKELTQFNHHLGENLKQYKRTFTPQYDYMPTFDTLYDSLKNQDGAAMGLAHPLEQTQRLEKHAPKSDFLTDLYMNFRQKCREKAIFSEVYYQSYEPKLNLFKQEPLTKSLLDMLSNACNLFKSGSIDTHGRNIFKRAF